MKGNLIAAALVVAGVAAAARAEPATEIELNRLEAHEGGCQASLVARNPGAVAHDSLRLDVVLFDRDGVILKRLAVEAGPLPAAKTMVKGFIAEGVRCEDIGSALLNDVLSCGGAAPCLDAVAVSARPPLSFTR